MLFPEIDLLQAAVVGPPNVFPNLHFQHAPSQPTGNIHELTTFVVIQSSEDMVASCRRFLVLALHDQMNLLIDIPSFLL